MTPPATTPRHQCHPHVRPASAAPSPPPTAPASPPLDDDTTLRASQAARDRWRSFYTSAKRPPPWELGGTSTPLRELVGGMAPSRAVELGCGSGGSAAFLAEQEGWQVLGVDYAEEAVAAARSRNSRAKFLNADVFSLLDVLQAGSYDLVVDQQASAMPPRTAIASPPILPPRPPSPLVLPLLANGRRGQGRSEGGSGVCSWSRARAPLSGASNVDGSKNSNPAELQVIKKLLRPGGLALVVTGNAQE